MTAIVQEKEKQTLQQWIKKHGSSVASIGGLLFCAIFFTITTGKTVIAAIVGRQLGDVTDRTANGRKFLQHVIADVRRSTRLLGSKLRSLTADDNLLQLIGIL